MGNTIGETKHIECGFCEINHKLRDWHPHYDFQMGIIQNEEGKSFEVFWCKNQWQAYCEITNVQKQKQAVNIN